MRVKYTRPWFPLTCSPALREEVISGVMAWSHSSVNINWSQCHQDCHLKTLTAMTIWLRDYIEHRVGDFVWRKHIAYNYSMNKLIQRALASSERMMCCLWKGIFSSCFAVLWYFMKSFRTLWNLGSLKRHHVVFFYFKVMSLKWSEWLNKS